MSKSISEDEGYARMWSMLDNCSYSPDGVMRGVILALQEWAKGKGLPDPIGEVVRVEREACAQIASDTESAENAVPYFNRVTGRQAAKDIATAIRARK